MVKGKTIKQREQGQIEAVGVFRKVILGKGAGMVAEVSSPVGPLASLK